MPLKMGARERWRRWASRLIGRGDAARRDAAGGDARRKGEGALRLTPDAIPRPAVPLATIAVPVALAEPTHPEFIKASHANQRKRARSGIRVAARPLPSVLVLGQSNMILGEVARVLEGEATVDLMQDPALLEVALDGGVVDLVVVDRVHGPNALEALWSVLLERGCSKHSVVLWGGADADEYRLDQRGVSYVTCAGNATATHVGALCRLILRDEAMHASLTTRDACG